MSRLFFLDFPLSISTEAIPAPGNMYRNIRIALCIFLILCLGFFVADTLHWHLVNDAAQIDYICFLMDHGMSPYKDIIEMNMPGIYLTNWTVMHMLGEGHLAWRIFDLMLLAVGGLAMLSIAWPYDWFAGALSATLFALFHGRDGPAQAGQRDFIIAVLLVCAYAFLFHATRKNQSWPMFFFGACMASAATIKPTPLPFCLLLLLLVAIKNWRERKPIASPLWICAAGMAVPFGIILGFLAYKHSLHAFLYVVQFMLPYYSHLGRKDFLFLLQASATPSILFLLFLALLLAVLTRRQWTWEIRMLALGFAFGILSFFGQGKGFPYHRYPMLAFLLLWACILFMLAVRQQGMVRALGVTGLGFGVILAPLYAARAHHRVWQEDFITSLSSDLASLGGKQLSGHVQCLYTPADCDTTLYRMQLVQATGLSYDYFIFGPEHQPVIESARARFWRAIQQNPPTIFIVGKGLYPNDLNDYQKLDNWPQFRNFLNTNYALYDERSFKPGDPGPRGFRIYVQKKELHPEHNAGLRQTLNTIKARETSQEILP